MGRWIVRKRPSLATVLAAFALFVALSGTAVAASVIITNNNQVAAHTIAGANAPSGVNKNLISGSVGTSDLHTGAATAAKIASNAVDSSKIVNGSILGADLSAPDVSGALGLRSDLKAIEPGSGVSFFESSIWTFGGNCFDQGGGDIRASVELDVSGTSKAYLSVGDSSGEVFGPNDAATTALAVASSSTVTQVGGGDFTVQALRSDNHLSGRVLAVVDYSDTSFQGSPMTAPFCVFRVDATGK
jgi:hypothetical protein